MYGKWTGRGWNPAPTQTRGMSEGRDALRGGAEARCGEVAIIKSRGIGHGEDPHGGEAEAVRGVVRAGMEPRPYQDGSEFMQRGIAWRCGMDGQTGVSTYPTNQPALVAGDAAEDVFE